MKKRIVSVMLAFVLILSVLPTSALAIGSLSNFVTKNVYVNGKFSDVPTTAWFAENVATAYELGLMTGNSDTYFNATGNVRISEAIAMAARLHSIYTTGTEKFVPSTPWYQSYVDYALENGIISRGYADYTIDASRAEFATILYGALPAESLQSINSIEDGAIPDVQMNTNYATAVYSLYRAGILTGNNSAGTYTPDSTIQRNAAAAIVTRMAATGLRKTFKLSTSLTAEGIFVKCSTAVFYIETYDEGGNAIASGSGFFISGSGVAVTNYHVIDGAYSAKIKTSTGETHDVLGVYDYSTGNDLALLQIDGSGFSYLDVGYSVQIVTGSTIYAIGSPLGLDNTISSGIVSNSVRSLDGISLRDKDLNSFERQLKLQTPTCLASELHVAAMQLLRANYSWQKPLRTIGVRATDLIPASTPQQLTMFEDAQKRERMETIERTVDDIRRRFGHYAIGRAITTNDKTLTNINPKEDHTIHPVGFFKAV